MTCIYRGVIILFTVGTILSFIFSQSGICQSSINMLQKYMFCSIVNRVNIVNKKNSLMACSPCNS